MIQLEKKECLDVIDGLWIPTKQDVGWIKSNNIICRYGRRKLELIEMMIFFFFLDKCWRCRYDPLVGATKLEINTKLGLDENSLVYMESLRNLTHVSLEFEKVKDEKGVEITYFMPLLHNASIARDNLIRVTFNQDFIAIVKNAQWGEVFSCDFFAKLKDEQAAKLYLLFVKLWQLTEKRTIELPIVKLLEGLGEQSPTLEAVKRLYEANAKLNAVYMDEDFLNERGLKKNKQINQKIFGLHFVYNNKTNSVIFEKVA